MNRSQLRDRLEYKHIKDILRGGEGENNQPPPAPPPLPPRGSKESLFMEVENGLNELDESGKQDIQTQMGDLVPVADLKNWIKSALSQKDTKEKIALTAANISMKLIQEITKLEVAKIKQKGGAWSNNGNGLGKRRQGVVESNLKPPPTIREPATRHPSGFSLPPAVSHPAPAPAPAATPVLPPSFRAQKPAEPAPSSEPS